MSETVWRAKPERTVTGGNARRSSLAPGTARPLGQLQKLDERRWQRQGMWRSTRGGRERQGKWGWDERGGCRALGGEASREG